ncbi:phosphoribosylanthranilate isomerase [Oceanicoccus sp. KOV_DT_Chl]|uniref:phosphoribosylanthranilate isomerase n=1 Tax=Oceanicoccus sp. KOV_DT_Chl TaxID=1904639 RepID=UPI000C7A597B|nr:phosphoribosylanthranilate isomerase [Oceanicoccus sp. KOV_DT_Chl]
MNRTRIKICGITRPEDAVAAVEAGADAIGLVFYAPSSRAVSIDQAAKICSVLPAFVSIVALTVNADLPLLQQIDKYLPISLYQYHGDENAADCMQLGRPYMKALRMRPDIVLLDEIASFSSAQAILLDAYQPGVPGGTGERFDWQRIPPQIRPQIVLAGGLQPDNIEQAVSSVKPFAVDVSGGVEESPGIKSSEKIMQFIQGVQCADRLALAG